MRNLLLILALTVGCQFALQAQTCTGPLSVTIGGATTNLQLSGSETHVDLSCNSLSGTPDGSITITPAGGSPNYTYDWGDLPGTDNGAARTLLAAGSYSVTIMDDNGCTFPIGPIVLTEPTPVTVTGDTTSLSCNSASGLPDGAIDITPGGGSVAADYTYLWSTSTGGTGLVVADQNQSNLSAGTYTVLVTDDNDCTATETFTLLEPTAVAVSGTGTNLSCNSVSGLPDGMIEITASGGTEAADYDYLWSTADGAGLVPADEDQSNLTAGTYTVLITDDKGCTAEESFTLTEPTAVTVTGDTTSLSCNAISGTADGAIDVTAGGGTEAGTYDYLWTTTDGSGLVPTDEDQTGLSAGTYTVLITDDKSCTVQASFTLDEPTPVAGTAELTNLSCNDASGLPNGEIDLSPTGGTVAADYDYAWTTLDGAGLNPTSQDQTQLAAGTYTVVISDDKDCTVELSFTLTEPTAVTCTATSPTILTSGFNIACAGGTGTIDVAASGGSGTGYTYSIDGTNFQASNQFTGNLAGTYTVTTKDDKGCTSTCEVTLTEPTPLVAGSCNYVQDLCQLGDGEIKIEVAGGVSPYNVAWSATPVAPNTTAGSLDQSSPQAIPASGGSVLFTGATGNNQYSFIVTDANGCETP